MVEGLKQPSRRLVCYVTDKGYLAPSLVSAMSCLPSLDSDTDIIIFYVGPESDIADLQRAFRDTPIRFQVMPPVWRGQFDESQFRLGQLPDTALGRFFIADSIAPEYEAILYIDGDTLATGDVTPLLDNCPSGLRFAAVADFVCFAHQHESWLGVDTRRYYAAMDWDASKYYYNSGVMVATPEAWRAISKAGFAFFIDNVALCHHIDQTSINMVCQHMAVNLPVRYNRQTNFRFFQKPGTLEPVIRHFCGYPKPWKDVAWPFVEDARAYARVAKELARISGVPRAAPTENFYRSARHFAKWGRQRIFDRRELQTTLDAIDAYERQTIALPAKRPAVQQRAAVAAE